MDLKSFTDVQKQLFQRLIEKLIARNKYSQSEIENIQKLLENVRDTKNFHKIMEKLKECGQFEFDGIEDNFNEGNYFSFGTDGKILNKSLSINLFTDGFCIKDPSKKYSGQTITPRHTIDAILGIKNRCGEIEGN